VLRPPGQRLEDEQVQGPLEELDRVLDEIEDLLQTHPKVAAVAVIGLPDRDRGERVCAVVETPAGQEPLTFAEMQQFCRDHQLMTQKIPEQLEVVEVLPRNATFKILKHELVKQLKDTEVSQ